MRVMPLAFEIEDGIDDMLEYLRASQAAILGDVADKHSRDVLSLGCKQKLRCRFANLPDAARCGLKLDREDRLDRVDDDERGPQPGDLFKDALDACFGQQV